MTTIMVVKMLMMMMDDNVDDDGGIVTDSLSPMVACTTQSVQPLVIHYDIHGCPFVRPSQSNPASVVDYGHFTRPGSTTALPPKPRPLPSPTETAQSADGDAASSATASTSSPPEDVVDDADDEKISAVMNAIRPMHPAYCMPSGDQVDCEMTM